MEFMDSGNAIASAGSTVTLSAAANPNYQFKEWQVNSGDVTISTDTFTIPNSDVVITAVFESMVIGANVQLKIGGDVSEGIAAYGSSIDLEAAKLLGMGGYPAISLIQSLLCIRLKAEAICRKVL